MTDIEFSFPDPEGPTPSNTLPVPTFGRIEWMKRSVRALGGVVLAAICRPRGMTYASVNNIRSVMVNSCGCGNETLVMVPYEDQYGIGKQIKLCLVCDGGAAWPRLESEEAVPSASEPPPFGEAPWVTET